MKKPHLLSAMCTSFFSIISISPQAALVDNGGGLIYDTVLDITWAQPDVRKTWDDSNSLNIQHWHAESSGQLRMDYKLSFRSDDTSLAR